MSDTPRTDAAMLSRHEGTNEVFDAHEPYFAWTDYWALGEHAKAIERELVKAKKESCQHVTCDDVNDLITKRNALEWIAKEYPHILQGLVDNVLDCPPILKQMIESYKEALCSKS